MTYKTWLEHWDNFTDMIDNIWFKIAPFGWLYRLPGNLFSNWPREIKWAYQRVARGYDDRVQWDLSYYLGKLILVHLKEFKKNLSEDKFMSYPATMKDLEGNDLGEEANIKNWKNIVDEMVEGFDYLMNHDDYWDAILEEHGDKRDTEETFMGYKMDSKKWNAKCSEVEAQMTKDKMEKAKQFVTHFWGLWD